MKTRAIHIEPTTRCTLACPQCPRTEYIHMVNSHDCDINTMVKACRGFDRVHLCGNHGDPIYHPHFHELIKTLRIGNPSLVITMHTNGAYRGREWWEATAALLNKGDTVTFSIDGLPTNNHIYRVNSLWSSVELGIRTLRANSDAEMVWKWIAFRYNETDVYAGTQLARDLGFDRFQIVKSHRRGDNDELSPSLSWQKIKEQASAAGIC